MKKHILKFYVTRVSAQGGTGGTESVCSRLLIALVLIIVLVIQSRVKEWMNTECPPACLHNSHPLSAGLPPFPPLTLLFWLYSIRMFSVSLLSRFLKDRETEFYVVNRLQARRFGNLISAGTTYVSPKLEAESGARTASDSNGTATPCLRVQRPDHLAQSLRLLPRPRLSGTIPLLSTYAFFEYTGTSLRLSRFLIYVNGERTMYVGWL